MLDKWVQGVNKDPEVKDKVRCKNVFRDRVIKMVKMKGSYLKEPGM